MIVHSPLFSHRQRHHRYRLRYHYQLQMRKREKLVALTFVDTEGGKVRCGFGVERCGRANTGLEVAMVAKCVKASHVVYIIDRFARSVAFLQKSAKRTRPRHCEKRNERNAKRFDQREKRNESCVLLQTQIFLLQSLFKNQ